MRQSLVVSLTLVLLVSSALRADRRPPSRTMRDPGFENLRFWQVAPAGYGRMRPVSGKDVHSGEHAVRMEVLPDAKRPCITLFGSRNNYESVYPDEKYILSLWMRGRGKATLTVFEYGRKGEEAVMSLLGRTDVGQAVELTGEWQQIKGEYMPAAANIAYLAPAVKLEGEGAWALVDDCSFAEKPSEIALKVALKSALVSPGNFVEYTIDVEPARPEKSALKVNVLVYDPNDFLMKRASLTVGGGGGVQERFRIPEDAAEGIYLFRFSVAGVGAGTGQAVEVVPSALRQEVVSLARKVTFTKPERLVFVGDSLTDLFRGRNYVDKVDLYLREGSPGQWEVFNAGVGGDTITRVAARLEKDVIAPKPTHVFLFLGHNDSKVAWPEYTKHTVEPEEFEKAYREVISQIKRETGAKVTIMSATSSVWEICQETAQKRSAEKKAHNLFGKPSELERYNEIARKVGDEFGCGYVDLYIPLKDIPDKRSYFTPDGVHISEKGNRLIAIEVLKYLAGSKE